MKKILYPQRPEWDALTQRVVRDDSAIEQRVSEIIERVRLDGDKALGELSLEIDSVELNSIEVTRQEFDEAADAIPQSLKDAIAFASHNITTFHRAQKFSPLSVEVIPGVKCFQKAVPINKVGLYIPGGSAPLFSTVLMLAIPAKIAGCPSVVLCTPALKDGKVAPAVLYAARCCGVDHVYKVGGAQAIAALAYGTQTIPKVEKIFGPGNRYVTKAKEIVSRFVSIDMPAGPSEVLVIADRSANPSYVAADLLSQAEHGPDSQVILACFQKDVAQKVEEALDKQLQSLPRCTIATKALEESRIIVFKTIDDVLEFTNLYAPEHLIINAALPWSLADRVTAAGSVFVGCNAPESAGDYASGTNHTLPTSGWARSCSGVNVDSYIRKITFQELSFEGLEALSNTIVTMAEAEGLEAHANAVKVRMER